jgi:hypothetical protein
VLGLFATVIYDVDNENYVRNGTDTFSGNHATFVLESKNFREIMRKVDCKDRNIRFAIAHSLQIGYHPREAFIGDKPVGHSEHPSYEDNGH